jgi:hypothetical protein
MENKMYTIRKMTISLLTAAVLAFAVSSGANAGGLLGDFLNGVTDTDIGTQLDEWNADNGNIVDHTFAGIADYYLPGSGEAIEGYYTYNREGLGGLIEEQMNRDQDPER